MSSDLQPLYSLLEEVQRQKNAILCSRPVRTDPADFHRYLDHLTAHGPELGDPARLVDQCIRQAETGVQELVQSLFEEEQQHWYRAERLLSHRAERPLSPAAPAPTSAPVRASVRAPAATPAVPAASRAGRARPLQLATERRAQQRRERQRPPPPPPPPRAAPPRAAARGAAPPAAPRGHHPQREPPAAVGAGGAAPNAAIPLSRPRHLEDTARAALFPPVGGGEPPAPPPPPPPPQPQPPAPASRAPPLLAYEEFQSARRPRRVVAPPADSVRLVHLGLDESSDASDDQEPPPVGPEDALSRGEEPPPALEESEPQQETGGTEGGASGPPRPPTSVGADSEPPTPRPAEPDETAGQGGQGGGEAGGARLAAGADTDGAGPPDRQSAGRATDVRGSSGGRRGARSAPATGGRSGGDRRRTDRAAAAVRRTPSAGGDARRSPGREPAVLRPAPSVGGPGVRWRDGPPAVPATGGHRPRARSDVRADVTWVPMDTGVFSSAGRQRTSGETKRKLEINAYKLIQEVVAASMAGCGDSPGSSRSDDVKGSSESVRQTARSPAAVAADALAAELGRAVADHRLPTAQFSSCSSRSGGPSPSEEGQAVGGPTGVEAAAERAGAGQTLQRQPLQQGEKQQPHQQQQGEQLRQRQQESQEQQRQHQQQQQHQQHLLYQQPQQHHQQQQQHQQHQQQQQHQQEQHQQPQHQQANRPREDGDRPGQRQSSPPSPPPKPPRALPAVESRSDPAETVSEATGPPSEVSPSVALPSLSRSAPPSEGRSAAAAAVDSDPDPDLEWLQRHAPVGGSGDHSAAETDDQVSDTALESDSAGLLPGGDSDSPAEGERHTESNGRQQATPGTAVYQRTVTEPPSAGGCLTTPPSAGGCLTALPAAGRTLGRPPQPPLSALTDTVSSTGCGSSSGSSAVTSPGGRGTPKGGRRTRPAAAAVALSPAPTGRAAPAPAVRAPAAAPRWADRAPAAGAAQVAVERTAPGRSETAIQTSQSLLPATVVSPQSEDGSSSALLQSGCCQTTPPAGLSAACQTQPDSPDRQQAGCQTETPGGAAGNLSLPPSPPGGATGHRPAQRTGGDGSLSRSDSSGHRSTASGEDLSEGEVLLPAWLRWVGAAGTATTVRSSAVTLAAASRHTIGSHLKEQEAAETTLSEGEVTGDMVPVGTFPSMSTLGPARSALGPGLSGTTLAPSGTTLGPGPSRTTLGPGPSRSTLGPSGSHLSAGQRRSSHLSTGGSHLAVSRGQLVAGRGSLPRPVPSVDSVPAARTASDSRLSAVRTGPGPQSAARSEVSGRPAARAASSPRLSTVGDRPSARRRRSWAAPAPAGADRPPEPGDLSDGEVSGSVRVRHVHIRPVRAGPTFELGEEGGPAPASEGLCSEGEAAEDGGLWTDQASLHQ